MRTRKHTIKRSDVTNVLYTIHFNLYKEDRFDRYETLIKVWQKSRHRSEVLNTFKTYLIERYDNWEENLVLREEPRKGFYGNMRACADLPDNYFEDAKHKAILLYSTDMSTIMNDIRYLRKRGVELQALESSEKQVDWKRLNCIAYESAA